MSIQLGSEPTKQPYVPTYSLTPMPFNLGSEQNKFNANKVESLIPISIQLGSEPIFNCDISFLGTLLTCNVANQVI